MTKPTVASLGIGLDRQQWRRSGSASAPSSRLRRRAPSALGPAAGGNDPEGRVLAYNDDERTASTTVKNGEFDDAATNE
jgi:hypothetical protein